MRYRVVHDTRGRIVSMSPTGVQKTEDGGSWSVEPQPAADQEAVEIEIDEQHESHHQLATEFMVDVTGGTPKLTHQPPDDKI